MLALSVSWRGHHGEAVNEINQNQKPKMDNLNDYAVAIYQSSKAEYPEIPPFHPSEDYPEYIFNGRTFLSLDNSVYEAVRESLHLLGLDNENYGTAKWNPLGGLIQPGDKVVIKPNFVRDFHSQGEDIFCVITHPSVIRAIVDYVYIALRGKGQIVIADAPQGDAHFENLIEKIRVDKIAELYKESLNFEIPILDLRKMRYEYGKEGFITQEARFELEGDPLGYVPINLGEYSEFADFNFYERIYGADYNRKETQRHHNKEVNEYLISKTILSADVIVSIPKLKVHKKAGVTLNLKNMIGINGDKNWLPHFRIGSPAEGGDEMPPDNIGKTEKLKHNVNRKLIDTFLSNENPFGEFAYKVIRKTYKNVKNIFGNREKKEKIVSGDWYGNDTIWRTILDLNKILIYADKEGRMCSIPQRKFFSIIDGIISGEKEGPLTPSPKRCGVLIAGFNPIAVDIVATRLMGFDYRKITKFRKILEDGKFMNSIFQITDPNAIELLTNVVEWNCIMKNIDNSLGFIPPKGWFGHI